MKSALRSQDRIIVALDTSDLAHAQMLVEKLSPVVGMFKIGLQLMHAMLEKIITPNLLEAQENLKQIRMLFHLLHGRVFWDGKLNDIPATVRGAAGETARLNVRMFNVHASSGPDAMKEAVMQADAYAETFAKADVSEETREALRPKVLAVTVLSSIDFFNCGVLFGDSLHAVVRRFAHLAKFVCGVDGVIAASREVRSIREECGEEFLIVTPGVRPYWAERNDQQCAATPFETVRNGADYLVIGRPITQPPPEIGSPTEAAIAISKEIELAMRGIQEAETRTGC